jgi:hypothetical protein
MDIDALTISYLSGDISAEVLQSSLEDLLDSPQEVYDIMERMNHERQSRSNQPKARPSLESTKPES